MRRIIWFVLGIPLGLIALMALSMGISHVYLAVKTYPEAVDVPNWSVLAQEQIPSIVTLDADGSRRITQLWIVEVNGRAYLRAGDSRWFANLRREPSLDLRIRGVSYACQVERVAEPQQVATVMAAFRAKYPRRSAFFRAIGIATNNVLALGCAGEV